MAALATTGRPRSVPNTSLVSWVTTVSPAPRCRAALAIRTKNRAPSPPRITATHANLRRGHYELATETIRPMRVAAAFTEPAQAI
jgi:hypothetical protein